MRTEEVKRLGLADLIVDVLEKPIERFEERLPELGVKVRPDAVVDDHPEIVKHFGGVKVRPYFWPSESDRELNRVYEELNPAGAGTRRARKRLIAGSCTAAFHCGQLRHDHLFQQLGGTLPRFKRFPLVRHDQQHAKSPDFFI